MRTASRALAMAAILLLASCQSKPPPVVKADEVPQCALPQPVAQRTYMLFFGQHSAAITPRDAQIIRAFVDEMQMFGDLKVRLLAYKDTSEVTPRDRGLDMRRGQAAARMIRAFGIAVDSSIQIEDHGTNWPLVPTPPNTAEPQNRRVELIASYGRQLRPFPYQADCLQWLHTHDCGPMVSEPQHAVCRKVQRVAAEFVQH